MKMSDETLDQDMAHLEKLTRVMIAHLPALDADTLTPIDVFRLRRAHGVALEAIDVLDLMLTDSVIAEEFIFVEGEEEMTLIRKGNEAAVNAALPAPFANEAAYIEQLTVETCQMIATITGKHPRAVRSLLEIADKHSDHPARKRTIERLFPEVEWTGSAPFMGHVVVENNEVIVPLNAGSLFANNVEIIPTREKLSDRVYHLFNNLRC